MELKKRLLNNNLKIQFPFIGKLILLLLLAVACNPSKQLTNDGNKLAAEGRHEDAVSYYYSALLKSPNYKPAKDALRENAQIVLNDKFKVFHQQVLDHKVEDAVKQYQYAVQFSRNAKNVGVLLEWPYEYDEVYDDVRREYTGILFDEAILLMNQKKYDLAEKKLQQIAVYDSNYAHVSVLRLHTVLDPLYDDGLRTLEAGKYQEAYEIFGKVVNLDEDYKDAKVRREEALSKATSRIGILPVVTRNTEINNVNDLLDNQVKKSTYAFVQVVDYEGMGNMLTARGWTGIDSLAQAIQAGKSLGLQYIMFTRISTVVDTFIPTHIETRIAYEAFTENIPNPYTETYSYITKFKKVEYNDVYEARIITYKVLSVLVSCDDQKALFIDEFESSKTDELHKFDYKGNPNNLYEELPQGNFLPPADKAWRDLFTSAKRSLLDKPVLIKELEKEIANRLAFDFNKAFKK
jgi:tetratricopeptide (TPR) repeat protein